MTQDSSHTVVILYKNHRGETAKRRIIPSGIKFESSEWHPEPQWLLVAYDCDKQVFRSFAMRDILRFDQVSNGES